MGAQVVTAPVAPLVFHAVEVTVCMPHGVCTEDSRRVQQRVDVVQLPAFTQYAGLPPDPCLVLTDATQRHQIRMNFAANAEHAMRGTSGRLVVRLEPVAVHQAVGATPSPLPDPAGPPQRPRYSGSGMPGTSCADLEPFRHHKSGGARHGAGAVGGPWDIADHDGTNLVESTVGQGKTFTIYLPRLVDEPSALEARPTFCAGLRWSSQVRLRGDLVRRPSKTSRPSTIWTLIVRPSFRAGGAGSIALRVVQTTGGYWLNPSLQSRASLLQVFSDKILLNLF